MAKHCETTILIVLIFLNKLVLANACLKYLFDKGKQETSLAQLTSGSEVLKEGGKVLIYQDYDTQPKFAQQVHFKYINMYLDEGEWSKQRKYSNFTSSFEDKF